MWGLMFVVAASSSAFARGEIPASAPGSSTQPSKQAGTTDARGMAADDCSRARALGKLCELTIEGEEVEGGVIRPDGTVIDPRLIARSQSLIRLRRDFIPEILQSANEVN
jgi:hypothetical protein